MSRDPVTRAVERQLCTGCGVCAGAFPDAIRMVDHPLHGRRPVVMPGPLSGAQARKAARLCAGIEADYRSLPVRDQIDAEWGPVRSVWRAYSRDPEERFKGSSGGVVTALSRFAIQKGDVSGAAHVSMSPQDARLNQTAISTDSENLMRGTGSRYSQSSPGEIIPAVLASQNPSLFVGKPCDVASMARASTALPQLAQKVGLSISIFCAGTPTLTGTKALLDRLGVPADARVTDLRYRGDGWPGQMKARWADQSGAVHDTQGIDYSEGWGEILQAHRRWRCAICADHTGAFADLSVGDPWHVPPKDGAEGGWSLVVVRTERGEALLRAAIAEGVIHAMAEDRQAIKAAQPWLEKAHAQVWGRRLAMRLLGLPVPTERGRPLLHLWLKLDWRERFASVLGTLKRIVRKKVWSSVRLSVDDVSR